MCVEACQVANQVSHVVLYPTILPVGSLDWLVAIISYSKLVARVKLLLVVILKPQEYNDLNFEPVRVISTNFESCI